MRALVLLAATTAALALAACDKGGTRAPCPVGKLCLERGNEAEIETLDPAKSSLINEDHVLGDMFSGLTQWDQVSRPVPAIATSWETSPDGLTWTFHMRSGLQFSDGTPLTAQDVAYSIDRALKKSTQSPVALTYLALIKDSDKLSSGAISTIIGDSLIVQDPTTLVIKLNKPGGFFLYALTYPTS